MTHEPTHHGAPGHCGEICDAVREGMPCPWDYRPGGECPAAPVDPRIASWVLDEEKRKHREAKFVPGRGIVEELSNIADGLDDTAKELMQFHRESHGKNRI